MSPWYALVAIFDYSIQGKNVLDADECSVSCFGYKLVISVIFQQPEVCSVLGLWNNVIGVIVLSYNFYIHFIEQKAEMPGWS